MHNTSVLALVFWCAACGGGDDPAVKLDASPPPIDAAIDAALQLPTDLIGVWIRIPSQTQENPPPPADRDRFHLNADGTFVYEEPGDDDTGTWTANSATFTMIADGTPPVTITTPYRIVTTRMMLPAFLPVGAVNGSVGTWRSTTIEDGKTTTQTLELRADMTATLQFESDNPKTYQGTWAYDADDVVFTTVVQQTTFHIHWQEIRGVVLGPLFERDPAAQAASPRRVRTGVHVDARDLATTLP